ncbi:MAG: hypothetical protein AN484_09500 [Aphanizomenon flos-aquae WA102]|uniref:Uncharacterized protein n=1 Tax=Aphanizomenon flos-aquae WA102 TaxID=1710896 RepID=A0A1B7X3P7_APHFL|nr:MAG: hypothetical protein AN484_09500 [Aphanizomenon flos-aquae WA102]
MKTALQELIEWCNSCLTDLTLSDGAKTALIVTIVRANDLLEKEKEQIMDAYISDRIPCSEQDAEDYYFSTYKIEKITITEHNQNK